LISVDQGFDLYGFFIRRLQAENDLAYSFSAAAALVSVSGLDALVSARDDVRMTC
jgi:hypothetical protein